MPTLDPRFVGSRIKYGHLLTAVFMLNLMLSLYFGLLVSGFLSRVPLKYNEISMLIIHMVWYL